MRKPALAASLLALVLSMATSGCVSTFGTALGTGGRDCSESIDQQAGADATLYPAVATGSPSPADNPSVTVHARAGQVLTAQVAWGGMGEAHIVYDGPEGNVTTTADGVWQLIVVSVPTTGNVTLGLEGNPLAFRVSYILQLIAAGCT